MMAHVLELLTFVWETLMEFLNTGFSLASPSYWRCLGSQQAPGLFLSLSLFCSLSRSLSFCFGFPNLLSESDKPSKAEPEKK